MHEMGSIARARVLQLLGQLGQQDSFLHTAMQQAILAARSTAANVPVSTVPLGPWFALVACAAFNKALWLCDQVAIYRIAISLI